MRCIDSIARATPWRLGASDGPRRDARGVSGLAPGGRRPRPRGDLRGAVDAYRQCEKRAPRQDRAEIASRLGWLNKESGNAGAANRYFARSRGDKLPPFMTYLIIAVTAVTSLSAMSGALIHCG